MGVDEFGVDKVGQPTQLQRAGKFPIRNLREILLSRQQTTNEPRHEKTKVLHMRKQRRRSASRSRS